MTLEELQAKVAALESKIVELEALLAQLVVATGVGR